MDGDLNQRVVWLLNHTTLREFEVPLLASLGFEVYCPKRFPRNPDNRSASVSYEFDSALTIPQAELELLNAFDFYSEPLTPEVIRILNDRFGTVIVAYMFPMFERVLAGFQGRILLRAFGSTHPTYTYYSFAHEVSTPAFERRLARVSDRFWFAQAYPNLKSIEPPMIQRRSIDLPLGLPDRVTRNHNAWTGGESKILFVCPEIESYDESKKIFGEFKQNFGDLGHVVCGAQSKPHPDPVVLGKVDAHVYDRFFRTCNAMFYHSKLPRHLHYHPLEAMCYGMPVVYMQQGMLGQLTDRKLPGACDTLNEAREKVQRLLASKDSPLAQEIRESQQEIYRLFTREYALDLWKKGFVERVISTPLQGRSSIGSIGILPLSDHLAIQQACNWLSESLSKHSRCRIGSLSPWHPKMDTSKYASFTWKSITNAQMRYAQRLSGYAQSLTEPTMLVPDDGVCDFMNCSTWLVVGDRCVEPIAPVKPYVFYYIRPVQGLRISRIAERSTAWTLQNADCILVNNAEDREWLIREYGVSQDWILVIDDRFDGGDLWRIIRNIP